MNATTNPKISVLIPAFNVEKYIGMCLDSLISQTYPYWQAFVMDDGSADSTYEIAKSYAEKDNRICVFKEKNEGVTKTRNKLLNKITDTDFLVFMDSDDFIHPQTFEASLYIQNKTSADIVEYNHIRTPIDSKPEDYAEKFSLNKIDFTFTADLSPLLYRSGRQGNWGNCCNKLFRYSAVKDVRFNEDLSYEDDYFYMTMIHTVAKSKATMSKNLYFWRKNPASQTGNFNYPRYIQCAVTRMQATWDYFVAGGRVPDDKKQEFLQDMANDFYRMSIKKTLRHLGSENLEAELFPIIRKAWLDYINKGIINPELLPFLDRLTLKQFLKGKIKAAKFLSYLHF